MVFHGITVHSIIKPPYRRAEFITGPGEVYWIKVPKEGCVYYYMGRGPRTSAELPKLQRDELFFICPTILRSSFPVEYKDARIYELSRREYWERLIETGELIDKAWPAWGYDPKKFFVKREMESGKTREQAEEWFNKTIAKIRSEPKLSSVEILEEKLSDHFEHDKITWRLFGIPSLINHYIKNKPVSEKARIVRGVFFYQFAERFGSTDFLLAEIVLRFMLEGYYYEIPEKLRHVSIALNPLERESLVLKELPQRAVDEFGFEMPLDLPSCDEDLLKMGFKEYRIEP